MATVQGSKLLDGVFKDKFKVIDDWAQNEGYHVNWTHGVWRENPNEQECPNLLKIGTIGGQEAYATYTCIGGVWSPIWKWEQCNTIEIEEVDLCEPYKRIKPQYLLAYIKILFMKHGRIDLSGHINISMNDIDHEKVAIKQMAYEGNAVVRKVRHRSQKVKGWRVKHWMSTQPNGVSKSSKAIQRKRRSIFKSAAIIKNDGKFYHPLIFFHITGLTF